MASCVWLACGAVKSKLKVEILRHSKPNLTTLFARQSRNCSTAPLNNGSFWYTHVTSIMVQKFSWAIDNLRRRAGLGIKKVQTQVKNLKAFQDKFDDRGEFPKFNKDQHVPEVPEVIRSTYRWYYLAVEGWAPEILYVSEIKQTVSRRPPQHLSKKSLRTSRFSGILTQWPLGVVRCYNSQPLKWNSPRENLTFDDTLFMLGRYGCIVFELLA